MINIKITEIFQLNDSHSTHDFVNINTEFDTELFIDPYKIKQSSVFPQGEKAFLKIENFFIYIYDLYENNREKEALYLFKFSM